MKLPTKFKLMGCTWTVDYIDTDKDDEWGHCDYETLTIVVKIKHKGKPVKQCLIEHTFFHELLHACLYMLNKSDLNDDEAFVDTLAGLMHQAFGEFELPDLM